ncbi:hypothetical protein C7S16_1348 [Burkholderia thailandensis]|uniref:Uncharacterized protein n=1 Tax=Burkholderia thailandensis TaxID=57975 RepID=A0AAW9D188_BURTH|nr:hypothetical protein [Burkholderia thailandensis]MDW9253781.1 hypothetical protein [Burkholderia thailandensis]
MHKRRTRKIEPKAELSMHGAPQLPAGWVRRSNISYREK